MQTAINYPPAAMVQATQPRCCKVVPVISTGHVTKDDGLQLLDDDMSAVLQVDADGQWSLISTLPSEMQEVLQHFHDLGYPWIILDCDGDVVPGLPTFEW